MSDKYECIEGCDKPVAFVRHTQFTGSHPYCAAHARSEPDFLKDDSSYTFWETLTEESHD